MAAPADRVLETIRNLLNEVCLVKKKLQMIRSDIECRCNNLAHNLHIHHNRQRPKTSRRSPPKKWSVNISGKTDHSDWGLFRDTKGGRSRNIRELWIFLGSEPSVTKSFQEHPRRHALITNAASGHSRLIYITNGMAEFAIYSTMISKLEVFQQILMAVYLVQSSAWRRQMENRSSNTVKHMFMFTWINGNLFTEFILLRTPLFIPLV